MKPKRPPEPSFDVGDCARTRHYVPPLLTGSLVRVVVVSPGRHVIRYQVQSVEYQADPTWVDEEDLSWILPV